MVEAIMDNRIPYILMGIFTVAGVVSKLVAGVTLKRLVNAAGNMSKSSHPLIRLVRAKFEHACMISDRVQNVDVFAQKYLYEYKVLGIRLHTLCRIGRGSAWLCLVTGLAGSFVTYRNDAAADQALQIMAAGVGGAVILTVLQMLTDEKYKLEAVKTYMVDYLENVCAHRYEKTAQREQKTAQAEQKNGGRELENPERPRPREEVPAPDYSTEISEPVMPEPVRMPEPGRTPEPVRAPERTPGPAVQADSASGIVQARDDGYLTGTAVEQNLREETISPVRNRKNRRKQEKTETFRDTSEELLLSESDAEGKGKEHPPISKEVLIREILEEFLA
ncbi:hypothetical protein [Sporofaciens sp. SGI.106]|uniref:hypothetical protein n=1 Tax=Sporofaciens sp. SGI.106 TaxID=3420568 RepID=UPI002A935E50|nr:hypothetical protein [Lachnoclostridium sp.]